MIILMIAALVAAQPVQPANPHARMAPMQHHEQHDATKKDCCKDCCKDMAARHESHGVERGHSAE